MILNIRKMKQNFFMRQQKDGRKLEEHRSCILKWTTSADAGLHFSCILHVLLGEVLDLPILSIHKHQITE